VCIRGIASRTYFGLYDDDDDDWLWASDTYTLSIERAYRVSRNFGGEGGPAVGGRLERGCRELGRHWPVAGRPVPFSTPPRQTLRWHTLASHLSIHTRSPQYLYDVSYDATSLCCWIAAIRSSYAVRTTRRPNAVYACAHSNCSVSGVHFRNVTFAVSTTTSRRPIPPHQLRIIGTSHGRRSLFFGLPDVLLAPIISYHCHRIEFLRCVRGGLLLRTARTPGASAKRLLFRAARMTEDKNLTPFSIADILKSDDRVARDGDGDAPTAAPAARRAKNCADGALDMTNNKCVDKKGKSAYRPLLYPSLQDARYLGVIRRKHYVHHSRIFSYIILIAYNIIIICLFGNKFCWDIMYL